MNKQLIEAIKYEIDLYVLNNKIKFIWNEYRPKWYIKYSYISNKLDVASTTNIRIIDVVYFNSYIDCKKCIDYIVKKIKDLNLSTALTLGEISE